MHRGPKSTIRFVLNAGMLQPSSLLGVPRAGAREPVFIGDFRLGRSDVERP
jgi:hypothetical protein